MTSLRRVASPQVADSHGKISNDLALFLVRGSRCVHYTCWARLLVDRGAAVEPCHQVAVGGAGGSKFVVAVLEVLASVEELLFEFGNTLTESADFVGSGEASFVEVLGEQAWRESGLGGPDDIEDLRRRNTELEQQVVELRRQLGEKDDDLSAARMTNRELMASLNRSARASSP
jgi:hypothetical protein